jgi:hypothetical protein
MLFAQTSRSNLKLKILLKVMRLWIKKLRQERRTRDDPLCMTGARFGTSCPIFVASIIALSISNLLCGPGMEGMLICSFLTISSGPTMWGIWPVKQRPSSLAPSTTVKRSVSPMKLMSEFILNNIQSSMD